MKKSTLILGLVAAGSIMLSVSCQNADKTKGSEGTQDTEESAKLAAPAGSIVYFNIDKVVEEYKMALDKRSEVEAKVATIQKEIDRRQKNLENAISDFSNKINKGLITSAAAAETERKLKQQELNFQQFAQQKQQEIMEEQQVMVNQIMDAIHTFVEKYNIEKGFSMILANQAGIPVVVGDSTLDITAEILEGLNAEYDPTTESDK